MSFLWKKINILIQQFVLNESIALKTFDFPHHDYIKIQASTN